MSNVAKPIDKPWRWKTGESGNPAGRPKGSRNAFSLAFVGDLTAAWAQHGPDILQKVALTDPSRFLGVCASVLPRDVALTIEQQHPGGLSPDDWELACSVFEAVRAADVRLARRPNPTSARMTNRAATAASSQSYFEENKPAPHPTEEDDDEVIEALAHEHDDLIEALNIILPKNARLH